MSIVRFGGGSEKVTIDGEKVRRKMNLKSLSFQVKNLPSTPFSALTSYGSNSTTNGDTLYLIGDSALTANNRYFARYSNGTWSEVENITSKFPTYSGQYRPDAGTSVFVWFNNALHVLTGTASLKMHLIWNGSWGTASVPPESIYAANGCVYNDAIYAIGGNGSCNIQKFDGSKWTILNRLPMIPSSAYYYLTNCSVAVFDNTIHILGGDATNNPSNDNKFHYTFDGTSYTKLPDLPFSCGGRDAFVWKGNLYAVGNGTNLYKYNNPGWTNVATVPENTAQLTISVLEDKIIMCGADKHCYTYTILYEEV